MSLAPKIWFTSDLHFGHANVIEYSHRPFLDVDNMNETLISRWNTRVAEADLVYCLGDMFLCSFKKAEAIAKRLHGIKVLIQGNHDKFRPGQLVRLGFVDIAREAVISIGSELVKLCHYPYAPPPELMSAYDTRGLRYLDRRPEPSGERYLLHGHVHEHWIHKTENHRLMINVGVDVWGYAPAAIADIELLANNLRGK